CASTAKLNKATEKSRSPKIIFSRDIGPFSEVAFGNSYFFFRGDHAKCLSKCFRFEIALPIALLSRLSRAHQGFLEMTINRTTILKS
ncbi:MAG TPA: hypothetical protein VNY32_12160, partial [Candidatus Acidoferrales bacterium]|nr:hypothetical protein [Candidatus Acidoferrales bacterium]